MRRVASGVVVLMMGWVTLAAQNAPLPPLQRIVEKPLSIQSPPHPCGPGVAGAVFQLGSTAGVPTGAERLPGLCDVEDVPLNDVVNLQGMTVEAALNRMVEVDPRYAWRERDGVIVIRPVAAWAAADNPLNLTVSGFVSRDRTYRGTLYRFGELMFGEPFPDEIVDAGTQDELLRRTFNVTATTGPAIDALDAVVRSHGALNWMASYKHAPASVDTLYISLHTFGGTGTMVQRHRKVSVASEEAVAPPLQRIVDSDLEVPLPIHACSLPAAVAKIVKRHQVPAGIEYLPGRCPGTPPRTAATETVSLAGLTVAAALDKLTALDPRFRWVESNGVAVVRPVRAWADPDNVLNFTAASFAIEEANLDVAMSAVVSALQSRPREALGDGIRSNQGSRLFSVTTGPTSMGGALDAIVRAHGEGWWELQDFGPGPGLRMLYLQTFDGSAVRSLVPAVPR